MKLIQLKKEIQQYQYFEDTDIIDVALASIIATRLKLGDPVWLILIGASSGGKSQILRPLAITDTKFLHRVDDLTENTFLSASKQGSEPSLLSRIGSIGMIVMSDLTVLFSKNKESRAAILSQFRMIYDGEMVKHSGNADKPISWKGYLGVLAGSTPSIYQHFEEVADMGERFIYYRMKPYNVHKATELAMNRVLYGKKLDEELGKLYGDYVKETVLAHEGKPIDLSDDIKRGILNISIFAEKVRTVAHTDFKENNIDRIPVSAMPMRVALQLTALAKGLWIMRGGTLSDADMRILEWCGYSLANEEKRACLRILAMSKYEVALKTQTIADHIGLATPVTNKILQNLTSTGVLLRSGSADGLFWSFRDKGDWAIVRKMEHITENASFNERGISSEEREELDEVANDALENFVRQ